MKRRNANMIFGKNGHGSDTFKITIPVDWTKKLGFTKDDKKAILKLDNNKIIIEKGEIKMFEVINFFDVYRKDILEKYGAENYKYHADFSVTSETVIGKFSTKKEAIDFARQTYNNCEPKYSVSGNNIYLERYDVYSYEDEDNPEMIQGFGLLIEDYEKIISNYNNDEDED